MKKISLSLLVVALAFGFALVTPSVTHAESTTTVNTNVTTRINALQKLINQLQALMAQLTNWSTSTSTATSTAGLPWGIQHAPGIQKRLEKGKGLPPGIMKKITGKGEHENEGGNDDDHHATTTATTTMDTTAPVISFITSTSVSSNSAKIIWVTNESADGRVWVSTSTPVDTSVAPTNSTNNLSYYHELPISGLASSTQYFYVTASKDSAGNTATTSASSFTTTAL